MGLFKPIADGLAIALRVTPNARRGGIDGVTVDADGQSYLKVAVTVPPENGKANDAVIRLLAKELHLPKATLSIAGGAQARRKILHIAGDARELETKLTAKLNEWIKPLTAA